MDDWNTVPEKSGLVDRVLESDISEDEAADMTLAFLAQWVPAGNRRCAAIPLPDRRHGTSHAAA